jgi:hypothetical protein
VLIGVFFTNVPFALRAGGGSIPELKSFPVSTVSVTETGSF